MRWLLILVLLAGCQGDKPDFRLFSPSCVCQQDGNPPVREKKRKEVK